MNRWTKFVTVALAVVVAVTAASALAQTNEQTKGKKAEAPKPTAEHKKLERFVGTWKGTGTMKESPFGPGGPLNYAETCEWFDGNFQVVCRSTGTSPMGPTKGISILSYDTARKKYTFYGADSTGWSGMARGTLENGKWAFESEEAMADKTIKGRYVMKEVSPTEHTFQYEMQKEDGSWNKIMEGKSTKGK